MSIELIFIIFTIWNIFWARRIELLESSGNQKLSRICSSIIVHRWFERGSEIKQLSNGSRKDDEQIFFLLFHDQRISSWRRISLITFFSDPYQWEVTSSVRKRPSRWDRFQPRFFFHCFQKKKKKKKRTLSQIDWERKDDGDLVYLSRERLEDHSILIGIVFGNEIEKKARGWLMYGTWSFRGDCLGIDP